MKYNYVVWSCKTPEGCCVLERIMNIQSKKALQKGKSLVENFPSDACFHMDDSFPKDIGIADNIRNISGLAVISKSHMEFIKSKDPASVESLPVSIFNHKGRVASSEYFVVHPLVVQDCINLKKTKNIGWSPMNSKLILSWDGEMVLNEERMDNNLLFFRLKYKPKLIMIRRDLAEAITAEGFTGVFFEEITEYNT